MSNQTVSTQTELIKIDAALSILSTAGEALQKNQSLVILATDKAQSILDTIEAEGMSDALDGEMNQWQVNAKAALERMNKRRTPFTQPLQQIQKAFTSLEGKIDPAKAESFYSRIQQHRNVYAKKKADEAKAKEQEILRQQAIAREVKEVALEAERLLRMQIDAYIENKLATMNRSFEAIKLTNFANAESNLRAAKVEMDPQWWNDLTVSPTYRIIESASAAGIVDEVKQAFELTAYAEYREAVEAKKVELIDKLPSKKIELEDMAKAGEEERIRLEEEAKRRQELEAAKLKLEAEEKRKKAEAEAQLKKDAAEAENLFNQSAELAEVREEDKPVRKGVKINVLHPLGYQQIAASWFQREGLKESLEKLEKKTLGQMKAAEEKHNFKTGEKIESKYLEHEDVVTAVAKKGE